MENLELEYEQYLNKVELVRIFKELKTQKDNEDMYLIGTFNVTDTEKEASIKCIEARNCLNILIKDIGNIKCYKRADERKIDFQAMLTELTFAKWLWNKYKFVNKTVKEMFEIKGPEIGGVFVNHREEDFYIKFLEDKLNFDIKSQFINNKYQSININQNAHKRFTEHNADFYVVGLIDGNPEDFSTVQKIYFVMITNKYFNLHAQAVNESKNPNFSPYWKIDMKPFKEFLKISDKII